MVNALTVLLSLAFAVPSLDATETPRASWPCTKVYWVEVPKIGANLEFTGQVASDCYFEKKEEADFSRLLSDFVQDTLQKALAVHKGPTAILYKNKPGQSIDLTYVKKLHGEELNVRANQYVVADGKEFVADSISKEVSGGSVGGHAKLIRGGFILSFVPSTFFKYKVQMFSKIRIQKPPLIPTALFKAMVQDAMERDILSLQSDLIPYLADHT